AIILLPRRTLRMLRCEDFSGLARCWNALRWKIIGANGDPIVPLSVTNPTLTGFRIDLGLPTRFAFRMCAGRQNNLWLFYEAEYSHLRSAPGYSFGRARDVCSS